MPAKIGMIIINAALAFWFALGSVLTLPFMGMPTLLNLRRLWESPLALPSAFTITAHSGAMGLPNNSAVAIKAAVQAGFDIVEIDLSFWPDGTPVVIHDSEPKQNKGLLLEEALAIIAKSDKTKINVDCKSSANMAEVYRLMLAYGLEERAFFTGVFEETRDEIITDCPLPYYLNCTTDAERRNDRAYARDLALKVKDGGYLGINCDFKQVSPEIIDAMHAQGLLVSLWTVNNSSDMIKTLSLGPDNITTKHPHRLLWLIEKWGENKSLFK